MSTDCELCDLHARPTGEAVFTSDHWVVQVLPGFEVEGWLAVVARRHVVGIGRLSPEEASTLGPVLSRVAAAAELATDAIRSYVVSLGERWQHWHALVAPVPEGLPDERRGLALLADAGTRRDPSAARATAERVGLILAEGSGQQSE